jgi:hypothetical protein
VTKEKRKVIWVPPCGAVSQNKLAGMVRGTRGAPGGAEPGTGDRTGGVLQDPPNILHSKMSVILRELGCVFRPTTAAVKIQIPA